MRLGYNQLNPNLLPSYLSPFTAAGRALLNSNVSSPAAVAAGITLPYPMFTGSVAPRATAGEPSVCSRR